MSAPQPPSYFPAPRRSHFCSQCGSPVDRRVPDGDNRERDICDHCGAIHYQNPRMVVGTVPTWQGRILLCRRAIEPRYDTWTLPAGFMELGESTAQGAERETLEESGARITLGQLYTVIDVPQVEQVHFFYLADAVGPELDPGPESLEARYFDEAEIPWDELSFRTVATTLQRYLEDRKRGTFPTQHYVLDSRR
ncbi:NUDIX hydrolase [Bordetella ansorpii]|uniref:NUDIX hydrolase n=1 Tax=Bordetella ansorpii TaxID=288768 RepID=A0A157SFC3_9BORD|nr:NUDIX hydrolase [Bordetella ansorpii]SAI69135.1 NUDIX hydrolase [Bordetella ansorpii]